MIVHLFPSQKITVDFVTLINKNFDNEEHIFYIYGNESEEKNKESLDSFSNVHYFDDRFFSKSWKEFYSIAKISNGIIFHSFLLTKKMIMRFQLNRNLFSKAAWFIWGGDLYDIQRNKKLPTRIRLSLEKSLLKKFSYIITNIHGDFNKAIKDFSLSADHLCARYMDQNIFKFDNVKKKNIKKKILVGNSATVSNNHIEILEKLRKFRDEDIEIHVPLSYGDKAYANQVKTIGENFFGSKFIPLMDFMDKENYNRFLETIDIAIFNNDRQQAVGNINGLLFLGAKIFLRNDTTMWDYFKISSMENIYEVGSIETSSFEDFVYYSNEIRKVNREVIESKCGEDNVVSEWREVFKVMNKQNI